MRENWNDLVTAYHEAIRHDDAQKTKRHRSYDKEQITRLKALHETRDAEAWRRAWQREARHQAKMMGYDGAIVLRKGDNHYTAQLTRDPVVGEIRLNRPVLVGTPLERCAEVLQDAIDLAVLSRRRWRTIESLGYKVDTAPDWSFLGHPVARAIHQELRSQPASAEQRTSMTEWYGPAAGIVPNEFRIVTQGARIKVGGIPIKLHANNMLARIHLDTTFPETIVTALTGRPLHQVVGLPGLMPGTVGGDAVIKSVNMDSSSMMLLVECPLVPMGDAPEGVDTSFLEEWWDKHWV